MKNIKLTDSLKESKSPSYFFNGTYTVPDNWFKDPKGILDMALIAAMHGKEVLINKYSIEDSNRSGKNLTINFKVYSYVNRDELMESFKGKSTRAESYKIK